MIYFIVDVNTQIGKNMYIMDHNIFMSNKTYLSQDVFIFLQICSNTRLIYFSNYGRKYSNWSNLGIIDHNSYKSNKTNLGQDILIFCRHVLTYCEFTPQME